MRNNAQGGGGVRNNARTYAPCMNLFTRVENHSTDGNEKKIFIGHHIEII